MMLENFTNYEYKEINRNGWSLVYNPEFEKYKDRYKNIVSEVKKVLDGEKVDGIDVELLKTSPNGKSYFRLEIGGEKFFVKKIPENHKQGGVEEFKTAQETRNRLLMANVEKVKVIEYIFAFTGNNSRFVVSRYDDKLDTTLAMYMNQCWKKGKTEDLKKLEVRFESLYKIFSDYYDFRPGNMAYDQDTDEIVLFDLNTIENFLVESSDDEL